MSMRNTIPKSQLMEIIKDVVRETIQEKKDKWIQRAVDPSHKGYCTPMTKSTCTPRRKALAKRFKSGDIHDDNVDESQGGTSVPHDYQGDNQHMQQMQEVAPPGFGPGKQHSDIYSKVMSQYKGNPKAAYATMWKIHNKISEAASAALKECGMEEAGLTSEDSYKVAPDTMATTQKDDQARKVQTDPKITENDVSKKSNGQPSNWGAQYTVRDGSSQNEQPGKLNRAFQIQKNPKVNETAYKTQGPGAKTFKDSPQFPDAWNDPTNP